MPVPAPLADAAFGGPVTWAGADATLPTTSIQLRLADGSRLRAEFNLSHTVGDIRRWVGGGAGGAWCSARLRCIWCCALHAFALTLRPCHPATPRRRFIRASRPDAAARPFRLATAFPPAQLDDDSATIEAAGLANSVVVQR